MLLGGVLPYIVLGYLPKFLHILKGHHIFRWVDCLNIVTHGVEIAAVRRKNPYFLFAVLCQSILVKMEFPPVVKAVCSKSPRNRGLLPVGLVSKVTSLPGGALLDSNQ